MARILIIDDGDAFRDMLREMLERFGYDVVVAPDGEAGIQLCREITPDLVITDMLMPSGGIANIYNIRKEFSGMKIITISGGTSISGEYLELTRSIPGVQRSFCKPFAMDEMLQAVKELVN